MNAKQTRIQFVKIGDTGKTEIFEMRNSIQILGQIKWFSQWRRYCFFPNDKSIWDASCLLEVKVFIDTLMLAKK